MGSPSPTGITGASFVDDLLAHIAEPATLHVLPALEPGQAEFDDELLESPLALPGFVLVAPLRPQADEEAVRRLAYATFSKFVFVSGFERRRNGEIVFKSKQARTDAGVPFVTALPETWYGPRPAPAAATVSPTLAVCHGHLVLASTEHAACAAIHALPTDGDLLPDLAAPRLARDTLRVDGATLAKLGRRNQRVLEFGRILEEGLTPAQAKLQIDTVLDIVGALRNLDIDLELGADETTLHLTLEGAR